MKTRLFLLIVCAALLSLNASAFLRDGKALTGNSLTEFGKYTIVNSDVQMVLNNQVVKTYELTYENTNTSILIGVLPDKGCTKFVVKSDEFEVQYECNRGVFGVKKIEKQYQDLPTEANIAKLNKVSYYAQRCICQNQKTEEELLGLIACYFPNLVNEEYQAYF